VAVVWLCQVAGLSPGAGLAHAGELDTSSQFYFKVRDLLGETSFAQYDTTDDIRTAVNAGLRAVSVDIGIVGYDTITISANTFSYALNDNFMEKGLPFLPFRVFLMSNDGQKIHGLSQIDSRLFGVTATGSSQEVYGPQVAGYCISGNRLWIYPAAPPGGKIYLEGPIEATPFGVAGGLETVVPETDRIAVVYYAAMLMATSRPTVENNAIAQRYWELYSRHVENRRGDYTRKVADVPIN